MNHLSVSMAPISQVTLLTNAPASSKHLVGTITTTLAGGATDPTSSAPPDASGVAPDPSPSQVATTTAQRLREQVLQQMGLDDNQLASLSPKDQRHVEDQVRGAIKDAVTQDASSYKPGSITDISA